MIYFCCFTFLCDLLSFSVFKKFIVNENKICILFKILIISILLFIIKLRDWKLIQNIFNWLNKSKKKIQFKIFLLLFILFSIWKIFKICFSWNFIKFNFILKRILLNNNLINSRLFIFYDSFYLFFWEIIL